MVLKKGTKAKTNEDNLSNYFSIQRDVAEVAESTTELEKNSMSADNLYVDSNEKFSQYK